MEIISEKDTLETLETLENTRSKACNILKIHSVIDIFPWIACNFKDIQLSTFFHGLFEVLRTFN